jgi:GxxExxY protein
LPRIYTDMLKYGEITDRILKCFYDVYNELGDGFLESVYEKALSIALKNEGLVFERQKGIPVYFRGIVVGDFTADIVVENKIILELKAIQRLDKVHEAQLINYLKATRIEIGFLLNFGVKPEFKRIIFNDKRKSQ